MGCRPLMLHVINYKEKVHVSSNSVLRLYILTFDYDETWP